MVCICIPCLLDDLFLADDNRLGLEMSTLAGRGTSPEAPVSPLSMDCDGSVRAVDGFASSTNTVLKALLENFPDKVGLASGLNEACRQASAKAPGSVRRLELELLRAGKVSRCLCLGYVCTADNVSRHRWNLASFSPCLFLVCGSFVTRCMSGTA